MPRRPSPAPAPSAADVLDQLRELVEADGRNTATIAAGLDPPMSRSQLWQILAGRNEPSLTTVLRILYGLNPPRRLNDLDPQ
jgi:DNA-binding phage protein